MVAALLDSSSSGQLVAKGRAELQQLARRLASLFPSLLSEDNVRKRRVSFVSSSKHRCVSSVEAFQEGLQQHWGQSGEAARHSGRRRPGVGCPSDVCCAGR